MEFVTYSNSTIQSLIDYREGEIKLGQKIQFLNSINTLSSIDTGIEYLILGLPEDIGPRANCGNSGSLKSWDVFVSKFINTQANRFIPAEKIMILGYVNFSSLQQKSDLLTFKGSDLKLGRSYVEDMDEFISSLIKKIQHIGKKLIIIGGGHNNAYPIIKGTSEALKTQLNIINCDPHADFRVLEGRHSGNPFSYAKTNDYINKYHVLGLHENYNSENMLDNMDKTDGVTYSMFEDFLFSNNTFTNMIAKGINNIASPNIGVELDVYSIKDFPSSAITPYGITLEQACQYLHQTVTALKPKYIHLPEAAIYDHNDKSKVGKSLTYLVTTIIKAFNKGIL